jgi:predicted Zn-dependent protease
MKNNTLNIALLVLSLSLFTTEAKEIALPEIGDSAGALISPQQEYQIGLSFYLRLQQSVELITDPEVNSYIQDLGYRLVTHSDGPHLPFHFFMVRASSVNAFAAPGGFIGMHSGLILTSESEDEVASVLAHEIAHVTQRHLLRSFEKHQQQSIPRTIALVAAALLAAADPAAGLAAITAVQAGGVQSRLNFTRSNEAEADNLGMHTLVRSGFDAMAMPRFFKKLQQSSRFYDSSAVPDFLRSHPVTTSRIAETRGRAVTYPLKRQVSDTLQFYLIREKLRVLATRDANKLVRYYEGVLNTRSSLNETASRYGYSLALAEAGQFTEARKVIKGLIDSDTDRLSYQIALAKIEISVGQLSSALNIYQQSQKIYPDDQALTLNQVDALLRANLPRQAAHLLLKQLELGYKSRGLYKLLAQAKQDMGEKSESHMWLAEYYYNSGRLERAADQLRIAADLARGDEFQLEKISARLRDVEVTLDKLEQL